MVLGSSKWADSEPWKMILSECDLIVKSGKPMSSRGAPWEQGEWVMCTLKVYTDSDCKERELYLISAGPEKRRGLTKNVIKVDGPYDDSGDEYWHGMVRYDEAKGNGLVTSDYEHYTVRRDSKDPGQGDGHGGRQFKIQLFHASTYFALKKQGLNVERLEDGSYILTTCNLWGQSFIPKKHRGLFTPNCRIL